MMHWVIPVTMVGMADGSSMVVSNCHLVAPKACPASIRGLGVEDMPRWVRRTGAGRAKMMVEINPGTTPSPNRTKVGIR